MSRGAGHPLLWLLLRDSRNAARGTLQRVARPRGALALAGLTFFIAFAASALRGSQSGAGNVAVYGGPGLMLLILLGAFSPSGLYFRPAEVDWLLTAPLSRRALVLYNVAVRSRTAIFSGLLLSLLPAWRLSSWGAAVTGYTLVFLLLQTSAQWMAVVRARLALSLSAAARRALGAAVFGLPLAALAFEVSLRRELDFNAFFEQSWVLAVIGAPTAPFLGTVAAPDFASWLVNASFAGAILVAAIAHICWLDVPYREAAVRQSERSARRFARMRSGGGAFGAGRARLARRIPMFPYLGGGGPVAWRQLQELARNPHGIALLLAVVGLVTVATVLIPWLRGGDAELMARMGRTGIFLVAFLPLLMGDNIACDFRRDLDRMGQLKSWPIAPLALAAGQIAPAALFATAVQLVGIAFLLWATAPLSAGLALLVVGLMPVVSWVALCIDNALFLWMPYRTVPEDPGDVGFVGRTFATALFKFAALALVLISSLAVSWGSLQLSGSRWVALASPLVWLLGACALGTLAVSRGFQRFDVTGDAPV